MMTSTFNGEHVAQYLRLTEAQLQRELSLAEQRRFELLKVELADQGILAGPQGTASPRLSRSGLALEISFARAQDAVRAYTRNVGLGGISLITNQNLTKGTLLTVQLHIPGVDVAIRASGIIAWSRPDAMGIAFTHLAKEDRARLAQLVLDNTTLLERVRSGMGRRAEVPGEARVIARRAVFMRLENEMLSDVLQEVLNASGFVVAAEAHAGTRPSAAVTDGVHAVEVGRILAGVPLVLVDGGSSEARFGNRVGGLKVAAFVDRPVLPNHVLDAVKRVLRA